MQSFTSITAFLFLFFGNQLYAQISTEEKINLLKDSSLLYYEKGNYERSIQLITEAINLFSQAANDESEGECKYILAKNFLKTGRKKTAFEYFLRASALLKKTKNKELLSECYYETGKICYDTRAYAKALLYFHSSDSLKPPELKDYTFKNNISILSGNAYFKLNKTKEAVNCYQNVLKNAENKGDTSMIILSLKKLIDVTNKEDDTDKTLELYNRLNEIYSEKKNVSESARIMNNKGYLYFQKGANTLALNAFQAAETLLSQKVPDSELRAVALTNIGICQRNNDNSEEAVSSLTKARKLYAEKSNFSKTAEINNLIALIYYRNKDLYNATEYSLEAIDDAKKANDMNMLKTSYETYSSILQALDDYQKAMDYYKMHLKIRDSLMVERKMAKQLILDEAGELENAEKDLQLKIADEEVKDIMLKQMKTEAEKREKELELISKEKELAKSEKEKALKILALERQKKDALLKEQQIKELENEKKIKDLQLRQKEVEEKQKQKEIMLLEIQNEKKELTIEKQDEVRKRIMWSMGLIVIILVLIGYSLLSARKKNKLLHEQKKRIEQSNDELNQQNEEIKAQKEFLETANQQITDQKFEIERKNEEITDSIKYAQRIQTAVLPPGDMKAAGLSDFFIFYKPKDIVSGDFYWMKEIGKNVVIAIADCTGHGVPGAFMSMLGISSLNDVVSKARFDNAGKILGRLRKKVKNSLGQTGKEYEQKDGMDMVLMIIDTENMKMQYAGANNPLVKISAGKVELIRGDRMPIGIHHREADFTNHEFKVKKGDVFYAYSDGFQDQFGGKNGKKFMSKRFKELLFKIHKEPMEKQKFLLENALTEWQSYKDENGHTYEQVDDVLVSGIKI